MKSYEILLYAIIITFILILLWFGYAFIYKTSVARLANLALKKYTPLAGTLGEKYVILCDPNLSSFNSDANLFTAVITFTPDMNNLNAPARPNVTKIFNIVYDDVVCSESNLKQYFSCINVN